MKYIKLFEQFILEGNKKAIKKLEAEIEDLQDQQESIDQEEDRDEWYSLEDRIEDLRDEIDALNK